MTKNKTMGLFVASFCLSVAMALPVTLAVSSSSLSASASSVATREIGKRSSWEPDAAEVEVDTSKLSALTISSSITPSSHSFTFTFSTGGQGYSDITSTYLLAPSDDAYQAVYEEVNKMTDTERNARDKQNALDENFDAIPDFNAYVFSITPTLGKSIFLPKKLFRNHLFGLSPSSIGVGAYDFSELIFSEPINLAQDVNIYIPSNINDVYADSFLNLDACSTRVHFFVELSQTQVEEQWDAGWNHGASVVYDYSYSDNAATVSGLRGSALSRIMEYEYDTEGNIVELVTENVIVAGVYLARAGSSLFGDKDANYLLGYFKEGNELPLYLEYQVEVSGQPNETRYEQFLLASQDALYNSVGAKISSWSTTMSIDIRVIAGETIDVDSLVIHNIYAKKDSDTSVEPDESAVYYISPRKVFAQSYEISDFLGISFQGVSHFMGNTSVKATITKGDQSIYQGLNPSGYRSNEANIISGKSYIRYRITSLSQSQYLIGYGDNKVSQFAVESPVSQYVLSSQVNKFSYIFKDLDVAADFDVKSLKSLAFIGFYVSIDVYGQNGPLARSNVSTRFGFVNIMSTGETANPFDAVSTGLFFFYKERYKNDEFRRLKPKKYLLKAVLGLFGSLIVIAAFTFAILRATLFANAIVVYNPVDPFIIIFMIASVLVIGYFIKFIVIQTRAGNQRRKALKLKLNEDVAEDGTN
jgi:hypothetical protein